MAHKKKHSGPVPPGNRPHAGPGAPPPPPDEQAARDPEPGAPFEDQDPKRRLGDFTGKGEHAFQQPGGKNDANR